MSQSQFIKNLNQELQRIDAASVSKRNEKIIEGFTKDSNPKAIILGKEYRVFNSNDYLGLRHHPRLKQAEHLATEQFGTGPGAVRFISGSLGINKKLEQKLARFHGRDDAIIFSSAFAANMAVLFSLLVPQSKDSVVNAKVLVVSDELNHRSIIDGIRVANLPKEQRVVFAHKNMEDLDRILRENVGKYDRVLIVTDGVFSMIGEVQPVDVLMEMAKKYDSKFALGVLVVIDDAHGVGAIGKTGRGSEEVTGARADVLVGTLGKAFGADGGYVVATQTIIDYLREAAATYIYSNSISPGTAGAGLEAVQLIDETDGDKLRKKLVKNISMFKKLAANNNLRFAAESIHPIQPVLVGDPHKTAKLVEYLFDQQILATKINYPVVPKNRDEIRVQIAATHTGDDIEYLVSQLTLGLNQLK